MSNQTTNYGLVNFEVVVRILKEQTKKKSYSYHGHFLILDLIDSRS